MHILIFSAISPKIDKHPYFTGFFDQKYKEVLCTFYFRGYIREEKGITQETMAHQLDVTQSNYGRLEKDDRRLNVVKLLKIVRILNVNISYIFNEVIAEIADEENPSFNNANKEVYDILVESLRAEIQHLKDEINFLRVMVRS